ncbi:MAG: hypothetical protein HQL58_10920 [Magnetococcales bacterium]|nr:hypothetical protein [Magnetococcales bacterium]
MNQSITLEQLPHIPIGELSALPVPELVRLQKEAAAAMSWIRTIQELMDGVLARRFNDQVNAIRQDNSKAYGVIRFSDGEIEVIVDRKKEVKWDQQKLATLASRIAADGDNPGEYIKTTLSVDERKYTAWPSYIRDIFEEARTVYSGRQTFRFETAADRKAVA